MAIMKNRAAVWVRVIAICLFISIAAQGQNVLEVVPGNALFAITINNFEFTLGQMDQYLAGITPIPNMVSMMGRKPLMEAFGDPNLANVNMRGQVAIFGTAIQKDPNSTPIMFTCAVIPVTDYKNFISMNPSATKADSNGVSTIGGNKMLVVQAGEYALLAQSREYSLQQTALKAIKEKNLSSGLSAAQREAAGKAPICVYGNIERVMKAYGPMIFSGMEQGKRAMAAKDPNMAQFAQMMSLYFDVAKTLMTETKDVMLIGSVKPDVINVKGTFTAISGTETAKMLAASTAAKGQNKMLSYLPDGAAMNVAGRVDKAFAIKMYDKFLSVFEPAMGKTYTAEEKIKLQNLVKTFINSTGDFAAFSMNVDPNHTPAFGFMYAAEVADANAFRKNIDNAVEMTKAPYFQDLFKGLAMKVAYEIKHNAETIDGVPIDVIKTTFKTTDPNMPAAQMIEKMYGDGIIQKMGIVNGTAIDVSGGDTDKQLKLLIDKAKKGGAGEVSEEIKTAMQLIPDSNEAMVFGTYNYLRIMKMGSALPNMPFPAEAFSKVETKSSIAFSGNIGDGALILNAAVPRQHVLEIKTAFEMLMQQQMNRQPLPGSQQH